MCGACVICWEFGIVASWRKIGQLFVFRVYIMFVLVFVLLNMSRVVTSTIEETLSETYFAITANFAGQMTDLGSKLPANHYLLTGGFHYLASPL